jgi:pSer/pThr/pTyr-binding forkhead associated (FHA) protein
MKKLFCAVVISGSLKGHKFFVTSDSRVLIGRSEKAHIRITCDNYCSREHALMYWDGNIYFIEDLKSTNGTFVNGKRMCGKCELHIGDVIGLGNTELLIGAKDYTDKRVFPDRKL